MCSFPQLLHEICGSAYNTGATEVDVEAEVCLERFSFVDGSVVERKNAGGEANGGVAVFEGRRCLPLGSVVRRSPDNWKDGFVGVVEEGVFMGAATVAMVLVGLPCVGILKPADSGETRLDGLS